MSHSHSAAPTLSRPPAEPDKAAKTPTPASAPGNDPSLLARARRRAALDGLKYSGDLEPGEAWSLFSTGSAELVDIRTLDEHRYVGHVEGVPLVSWELGEGRVRNPRFLRELAARVPKDRPVMFVCRASNRSVEAAIAATAGGWIEAYNVLEGFEGSEDIDPVNGGPGWCARGLPWVDA